MFNVWDWKFHANLRKTRNKRGWMIRLFMKGSPMNSSTKTRLRNLYRSQQRGLPLFQTQSPAWNAGLLVPGLCWVVMSSAAIFEASGHWPVPVERDTLPQSHDQGWPRPVCPHPPIPHYSVSPHITLPTAPYGSKIDIVSSWAQSWQRPSQQFELS